MGSCLVCGFLPDTILGVDVDTIFAFQTSKVVKIKDRTLGIVNCLLVLAIFLFICVFQMWYRGEHFRITEPEGIYRLQWQQPTKGCNPSHVECKSDYKSVKHLPYCSQCESSKSKLPATKPCDYFDAKELPLVLPQGVLIPTYIETFDQARNCSVDTAECERKWVFTGEDGRPQHGKGAATATTAVFVADVGEFTVLIDHSFRTRTGAPACNGHQSCNDYEMQGFWYMPGDTDQTAKPIPCKHKQCREFQEQSDRQQEDAHAGPPEGLTDAPHEAQGRHSSEVRMTGFRGSRSKLSGRLSIGSGDDDFMLRADSRRDRSLSTEPVQEEAALEEPFAIADGDVFSLNTLFAMAGHALDEDMPGMEGGDTARFRGAVLVMEINYNNKRPWTLFRPRNPWYSVKVTTRKVTDFKHSYVERLQEDSRKLVTAYGTYVIVQQSGAIAVWDFGEVCAWLGGAAGLIMISATIMDFLATSVMPRKAEYAALKFQESIDFHEQRKDAK